MPRDTTHPRLTAASILVAGLVAAVALIAATSSTEAKAGGDAGFTYKVVKFEYSATGFVSATRESVNCIAGVSEDIGGNAKSAVSEVTNLGSLGDAELNIENKGSRGNIQAENVFDYTFTGGHRETTSCEGGQVASSTNTNCTDRITSTTQAYGLIKGGVGNQVRITWTFTQETAGAWVPNFTCVKTINFLSKDECKSPKTDLALLTEHTVKLPFLCEVPLTTSPPANSGYDHYEGLSKVSGFVKLKRLKD